MRLSSFALVFIVPCALASSAMAQSRGSAEIYKDQDYRGERRVLDREVRNFQDLGLNDRVSSIRINGGAWEFCEDADFRGRCITVGRDERNLAGTGFDDRLSSARPVADRRDDRSDNRPGNNQGNNRGNDRNGGVTLYLDDNYRGATREAGETRDFRNIDFNDAVSSIRIRSGVWEFCTDADFRGRCVTFDRDVSSLSQFRLNDQISSMRRVR